MLSLHFVSIKRMWQNIKYKMEHWHGFSQTDKWQVPSKLLVLLWQNWTFLILFSSISAPWPGLVDCCPPGVGCHVETIWSFCRDKQWVSPHTLSSDHRELRELSLSGGGWWLVNVELYMKFELFHLKSFTHDNDPTLVWCQSLATSISAS